MNRRAALVAVVLAVAAAVSFLVAPHATAAGAPEAAWWSRTTTTDPASEVPAALPVGATVPATVPSPAVPEGQLLVDGTNEGPTAVTALRWNLAGSTSPTLTLPIDAGSTVNPQSVVLACKVAGGWNQPEALPGTWETRPIGDAARCVNGIVAEDLSSITFGLSPLVVNDVLDIALVNGEIPEADIQEAPAKINYSAFRWTFAVPGPDALTVSPAAPDAVEFTPPSFDSGDASAPPAASGSNFSAPASTGGGGFSTGGSSASPGAVTPIETPTAVAAPTTVAAAPVSDTTALAAPQPVVSTSSRTNRTIGFLCLLGCALAAGWAYLTAPDEDAGIGLGRFRTAIPAVAVPEGLTAVRRALGMVEPDVDEPPRGGLGRFARERDRAPTRIG